MTHFKQATISCPGGRADNQDYAECNSLSNDVLVCALADGLGGHQGGQTASLLAVTTILQSVLQDFCFSPKGLAALHEKAQEAILSAQEQSGFESMRSTLVFLVICQNQALWLHCGDSRLYHFRGDQVIAQTNDHSVPALFVAAEDIRPDEVRHHPDRNKLLRALGGEGSEANATVLKHPVKIQCNDRFLLCSDGFWEYVMEHEMLALWKGDVDIWLQNMEAMLLKRAEGEYDNYTACAIQVTTCQ